MPAPPGETPRSPRAPSPPRRTTTTTMLADQARERRRTQRQIFPEPKAPSTPSDVLPIGTPKNGTASESAVALDDANPLALGLWAVDATLTATATGATSTTLALRIRDSDNVDAAGSPGPPYRFGSETSVNAAMTAMYVADGDHALYAEIGTQDTDGTLDGFEITIHAILIAHLS